MSQDLKALRLVAFAVLSFNSIILGIMLLIQDLYLGMISVWIASGMGVYFTIKIYRNLEIEDE